MKRAIFFFDGFNCYHAIARSPQHVQFKWLSYQALATTLIRRNHEQLAKVFFFTAYYPIRTQDAFHNCIPATEKQRKIREDLERRKRHEAFNAAQEHFRVTIVEGKFYRRQSRCPICGGSFIRHEEKLTDVNIALEIVKQAYLDAYDVAYVVTADSDIAPAVSLVKELFPQKELVSVTPPGLKCFLLDSICDRRMRIKTKQLKGALLPDSFALKDGRIVEKPGRIKTPGRFD